MQYLWAYHGVVESIQLQDLVRKTSTSMCCCHSQNTLSTDASEAPFVRILPGVRVTLPLLPFKVRNYSFTNGLHVCRGDCYSGRQQTWNACAPFGGLGSAGWSPHARWGARPQIVFIGYFDPLYIFHLYAHEEVIHFRVRVRVSRTSFGQGYSEIILIASTAVNAHNWLGLSNHYLFHWRYHTRFHTRPCIQ